MTPEQEQALEQAHADARLLREWCMQTEHMAMNHAPTAEQRNAAMQIVEAVRRAATALVIQGCNYNSILDFEQETEQWKAVFRPGNIVESDIRDVRAASVMTRTAAARKDTAQHDRDILLRRADRLARLADTLQPLALP